MLISDKYQQKYHPNVDFSRTNSNGREHCPQSTDTVGFGQQMLQNLRTRMNSDIKYLVRYSSIYLIGVLWCIICLSNMTTKHSQNANIFATVFYLVNSNLCKCCKQSTFRWKTCWMSSDHVTQFPILQYKTKTIIHVNTPIRWSL